MSIQFGRWKIKSYINLTVSQGQNWWEGDQHAPVLPYTLCTKMHELSFNSALQVIIIIIITFEFEFHEYFYASPPFCDPFTGPSTAPPRALTATVTECF